MRKSKNRYFYHIFVSPGDAPGAPTITLNVVWMEREFDAYKLSPASAHLPVTVSEIERDIGRKSSFFHTPLHSTLPLGGGGFPSEYRHAVWHGKLEWLGYPMVKKFRRYLYSFWRNSRTWQIDGRTDTAWQHRPRLCIASRGKNADGCATICEWYDGDILSYETGNSIASILTSYRFIKMAAAAVQYYFRFRIYWYRCLQKVKVHISQLMAEI